MCLCSSSQIHRLTSVYHAMESVNRKVFGNHTIQSTISRVSFGRRLSNLLFFCLRASATAVAMSASNQKPNTDSRECAIFDAQIVFGSQRTWFTVKRTVRLLDFRRNTEKIERRESSPKDRYWENLFINEWTWNMHNGALYLHRSEWWPLFLASVCVRVRGWILYKI